jgi:CRISPR system Cascade subunit CasB
MTNSETLPLEGDPATQSAATAPPRRKIIASMAGQLGADHYATGERAALKRMDPDRPSSGAYAAAVRLLLNADADAEVKNDARLKRWTPLIHAMALMSGPGHAPHGWRDEHAAGRVMFDSGYSEDRLRRLLEARGKTFDDLLSRMARFLAAKRAVINWTDLAPLVLDTEESECAEKARLNLMRQFLTREARHAREAGENGQAGA